jgi:hypothetical protein
MDERLKNLRGPGRRQFLRWSATIAAALGLERSRYLNVLNDHAGEAMASGGACASTMRSVHIVAGHGGLAYFTLIWPQVAIATGNNPSYAFHAMGSATMASGTTNPLAYAPESPFQTLSATRQMTAFMAGANETHTTVPTTAATISTGTSMLATVAAIQSANPSLLPVIGINPINFGVAAGAPPVATVNDSAGLVQLFNSTASQTILSKPSNAALHEAYYKAFAGLNAAAGRQTFSPGLDTGKVAANLLGKNLALQLTPTAADDMRYGIASTTSDFGSTPSELTELAHAMCTAVKAFKLGLTSSVIIPAMTIDDPHSLFASGDQQAQAVAATLGNIFNAFMADCAATPDPACSSSTLADSIVLTVHGDTTKDCGVRSGWPDGTVGNSNTLYVFGNGYLPTGWFGNITVDSSGNENLTIFDPTSGQPVTGSMLTTADTAAPAAAAVAYAVSKGDMQRVQDFYNGPSIAGITNANQM